MTKRLKKCAKTTINTQITIVLIFLLLLKTFLCFSDAKIAKLSTAPEMMGRPLEYEPLKSIIAC